MELTRDIPVQKTTRSRLPLVNWQQLSFGEHLSDHMFSSLYQDGEWLAAQVLPYQDIVLSPTALALHYGQSVFEGMKAFRMQNGRINIFRIHRHWERLNQSLERMCMPPLPFELFEAALRRLVQVDAGWVPEGRDTALYLRPLVFASEARLGVKVSDEYRFLVVSSPVPALYPQPLKVKVERQYIRAAKGGVGYAKCAGNYGAAFYPTQIAKQEGFDQVLWTDASEHEYFEESGTMNIFFVLGNQLITPPLSDSILDGVTRDSLLTLANDLGYTTVERPIGVREVLQALESGFAVEAFGAGTAAVVAPISVLGVDGELYHLPTYKDASVLFRLKRALEAIRTGQAEDVYGWNYLV